MRFLNYTLTAILFLGIFSSGFAQTAYNQYDEDGKRHGTWQKYYPDSKQLRYEGKFNHGKEVGEFRFYCEDCKDKPNAVIRYTKNSHIADATYFDKKGKTVGYGKMENQKRIGKWVFFHPGTEKIMSEENYSDGALHGLTVTYYPNGNKTEEIEYRQGEQHGVHNYYSETGVRIKELLYQDGKLHGPALYSDAHGQTTIEGAYKNGKKDGLWKYYENGEVVLEETYPKKHERRSVPD